MNYYPKPYGLECGDGWKSIVDRTHEKLKHIDPDYTIIQVKEKFGGLSYYFDASVEYDSIQHDIMNDIVAAAERMASLTCEICGADSYMDNVETRVHHHWYYNYCEKCSDKLIEDRHRYYGTGD
jgi:hypothetical protein